MNISKRKQKSHTPTYMGERTHTHIQKRAHAHTHTHIKTRMYSRTHTPIHTQKYKITYTHKNTCIRINTIKQKKITHTHAPSSIG